MTAPICPITGQPLPDGYYLHPTLRTRVENLGRAMRYIPQIAQETGLGLIKPSRMYNAPTGKTSHPQMLPAVWEAIDEMLTVIATWAPLISGHLNQPAAGEYEALGIQITTHADQLLRWHKAPTMLDELEYTLNRCEHLASPPHARRLTTCPTCNKRMYTRATRKHATCTQCEQTIQIQHRQADMWEAALYTWMPRTHAAAVVYLTTGREITRSQLKHWIADGHVKPLGQRRLLQPNELITAMRSKRPYKKRQNLRNT